MSFKCKLGGFSGVLERDEDYIYIVGRKKFLTAYETITPIFLIVDVTTYYKKVFESMTNIYIELPYSN